MIAEGDKYEYVLADKTGAAGSTEGVVAMLSDIWEGHSDRHAGGPLCVPVSQEAAEAAFAVAVTLVNLFSKRAVRPRVVPTASGRAIERGRFTPSANL